MKYKQRKPTNYKLVKDSFMFKYYRVFCDNPIAYKTDMMTHSDLYREFIQRLFKTFLGRYYEI